LNIHAETNFDPRAFGAFDQSLSEELNVNEVGGIVPAEFGRNLPRVSMDALATVKVGRNDVLRMAQDPAKKTPDIVATILAWGQMHRGSRNRFFEQETTDWLTACDDLRAGKFSRADAYTKFSELQAQGKMKGMGPAYYTKLIHFLLKRDQGHPAPGYIMDQWAGCSVNILCGRQVVLMDSTFVWNKSGALKSTYIVSNQNGPDRYEEFCSILDRLAAKIGRTPEETDRAIMSEGGKSPKPWRGFVIENRRPSYE